MTERNDNHSQQRNNSKSGLQKNRITVSRSHAGSVKTVIGEKLGANSEIIVAAGSGIYYQLIEH